MLLLVIILALTVSTYYFTTISVKEIENDYLLNIRAALKQAKQDLLNYAITHAVGNGSGDAGEYGYLPCPNITSDTLIPDTEGKQNLTCGSKNVNSIGYLPWKSMNSEILRDGNGNCLWYAVSGGYKNYPNSGLINEDTNGMFQTVDAAGAVITGNNPEDRIVAVVFAPGPALSGQQRTFDKDFLCGNDDGSNVSAYLEGTVMTDNSVLKAATDKIDQFVHASLISDEAAPPYNDYFITITRDEIWSAITTNTGFIQKMTNLTEALAVCLRDYAAANGLNRLPWPAEIDLDDYRVNNNYDDTDGGSGYAGRFPFKVDTSNTAIGVAGNDELFTEASCDNLPLASGGLAHLLGDATGSDEEYKNLWQNWKDHFFYAVSGAYSPDNVAATCGTCITTADTTQRAAVVIYSGSRQSGQLRNGPIDVETKNDIDSYIESGNEAVFPDNAGDGVYQTGTNLSANEIMFCINTDLTVVAC